MFNILKKLQKDDSGAMMIYLALMLPVFMLCLLIAIDGSNALAQKSKIGYTQDASAIAYSSVSEEQLLAAGVSREDYAMKFSQLNLEDGSSAGQYQINLSENGNVITASSQVIGSNGTFFGKVTGFGDAPLGTGQATKVLKTADSSSTSQQVLLALVLDGSGSMKDHIETLKTAYTDLVKSTLENHSDQDFWISQIIFDGDIRSSEDYSNNFLTVLGWESLISYGFKTHGFKGMQEALVVTDRQLASAPRFQSYQKKVVFMTDGKMRNGSSGDRALHAECTKAKDAGYEVYGIAFGSADVGVITTCASSPEHVKTASTGEQLIDAFRSITTRIISSRIAS